MEPQRIAYYPPAWVAADPVRTEKLRELEATAISLALVSRELAVAWGGLKTHFNRLALQDDPPLLELTATEDRIVSYSKEQIAVTQRLRAQHTGLMKRLAQSLGEDGVSLDHLVQARLELKSVNEIIATRRRNLAVAGDTLDCCRQIQVTLRSYPELFAFCEGSLRAISQQLSALIADEYDLADTLDFYAASIRLTI